MYEKLKIISLSIDRLSFRESLDKVMQWSLSHTPAYVCFANVHMTIEAYKDPVFLEQLNNASLVVADGKPIAVASNILYGKKQERISGMDFMPRILEEINAAKGTIFLYGSSNHVLEALEKKLAIIYPAVKIGGAISPPFRALEPSEQEAYIKQINDSGANLVFVALGCPKQEKWMASNYKKINATLLGVGGAFPVVAGIHKRSPGWMQRWGLEWLYRLIQEPRRMFKRYLYTNSYFLYLLVKEKIKT
jgi:N-acetylglucosaminyldiphosphoundecaprenol N-acetyl-beta-D-mannosaminyltransferase